MQAHANPMHPSVSRRDGDVDRSVEGAEQAQQSSGASVAQHSGIAECQDGSHPAAGVGKTGMAHRVHAAMNAVEKPGADTPSDRVVADSRLSKLPN